MYSKEKLNDRKVQNLLTGNKVPLINQFVSSVYRVE